MVHGYRCQPCLMKPNCSEDPEATCQVEVLGRAIDWCFLGRLGLSLHLCSQLCHGGTDLAIWRRLEKHIGTQSN